MTTTRMQPMNQATGRTERTNMQDTLARFFGNLADRVSGPMHFRIYLQPLMAVIFAIRDGKRDAHEGQAAYFWGLFTDPEHRRARMRSGWKSVGKIIVLALILDAVYQFIALGWFYPGEALLVAFMLAVVPYIALRGLTNRFTPRKEGNGGWKPDEVVKVK
jgi:hypothetical protein